MLLMIMPLGKQRETKLHKLCGQPGGQLKFDKFRFVVVMYYEYLCCHFWTGLSHVCWLKYICIVLMCDIYYCCHFWTSLSHVYWLELLLIYITADIYYC
jgi:hypothetical protein